MKFTTPRASLLAAIDRVRNVIERKNTIPVLGNLRLACLKGELEIVGTDLDMEITARTAVDMERHGACTVPAATLHDILRKLPDGAAVSFDHPSLDEPATIRAGRARFTLPTLPPADFPDMQGPGPSGLRLDLPASTLVKMIASVEASISTEESRYYLCGIYLHAADGHLRAVATNGHTLAWRDTDIEVPDTMPAVILPRKACAEMRRLADANAASDVSLIISADKIRMACGETVLVTKLIDGVFPDYRRIAPEPAETPIVIEAADWAAAAARVSTVSSERGRAVKLTFHDHTCTLFVSNPDGGDAEDVIAASHEGDEIIIGLNADYIASMCAATGGGKLCLSISAAGAPVLVQAQADPAFLGLIMPMRV